MLIAQTVALERLLGADLLERTKRRAELTEAGRDWSFVANATVFAV